MMSLIWVVFMSTALKGNNLAQNYIYHSNIFESKAQHRLNGLLEK